MNIDCDFCKEMTDYHLKAAVLWTATFAKQSGLCDSDRLALEFQIKCENAVSRLKGELRLLEHRQ